MLAKTLQGLIEADLTTARELSEYAGVSNSTVYRWISGESRPDFDAIRMLVRHLPEPRAQEAICTAFLAGTDWQATHQAMDLDVNHDGSIDCDDALDAAIEAVRGAGESLSSLREAHRDGSMTSDDAVALASQLHDVVRQCVLAERVLLNLAEVNRRRKAKQANLRLAE